jgi:carbonic anhydrase
MKSSILFSLTMPAVLFAGLTLLTAKEPIEVSVVTRSLQRALTPDEIVSELQKGNERFLNDEMIDFDFKAQMSKTADGQNPACIMLGCIDSRVIPEIVFDTTIGDSFDTRVAGNVVGHDVAGSMEYACAKAGSKLVLVVGHTNCGAVKGAIDGVELGNLTGLLAKIKPAIDASKDFPGEKSTKNKAYVSAVVKKNVELTIEEIRKVSPVLKEMEEGDKIDIRGCVYDVATGKVEFLESAAIEP